MLAGSLFVALVSVFTGFAQPVVRFELLIPWMTSLLGGFLIGFGLLALLRQQAKVGGVNILTLNDKQGRYLGV